MDVEEDEKKTEMPSNRKKKIKYAQKYSARYQNNPLFSDWLTRSSKGELYAFCVPCEKDLRVTAGKIDMIKHSKTKKHNIAHNKKYDLKSQIVKFDTKGSTLSEEQMTEFIEEDQCPLSSSEPLYKRSSFAPSPKTKSGHSVSAYLHDPPERDVTASAGIEISTGRDYATEYFGKCVTEHLRQMPLVNALRCQEKIYRLLIEERLAAEMETIISVSANEKTASPQWVTHVNIPVDGSSPMEVKNL